jgi:hypothetical protein
MEADETAVDMGNAVEVKRGAGTRRAVAGGTERGKCRAKVWQVNWQPGSVAEVAKNLIAVSGRGDLVR